MRIDVITIFPEMFSSVFESSTIKIAQRKKLLNLKVHNLRDYSCDKHKKVDAPVYGGGPGMVLKCEPLFKAAESIKKKRTPQPLPGRQASARCKTILLSPKGKVLNQALAKGLSKLKQLILICGRYEDVDERVRKHLVDEEISIGNYVLSGGEPAAMVLVDVLARLIPGVVGDYESVKQESFEEGILDYPHYTKPRVFRGWVVPEVLLSGNHAKIEEWRKKEALKITKKLRPDLLKYKKGV